MTNEELLANRMALRQLGMYEEDEQDIYDDRRQHSTQINHGKVVDDLCHKIARSAFNSRQTSSRGTHRFNEHAQDLWGSIKDLTKRPLVRELALIGTVLSLKLGLYYSFRKASKMGIEEIAEL